MFKKYFILLVIFIAITSCDKDVSVTPPNPRIYSGFINIQSYPEGAMIYLNGRISGKTSPDSIKWLEEDYYEVTLKKQYYRDTTFYVNVIEGERNYLFIDYTNNPLMRGYIECNTNPAGAELYIDDSLIATTPCVVDGLWPGIYSVLLKRDGYKNTPLSLVVMSNNGTEANITMIDSSKWDVFSTVDTNIPSDNLLSVAAGLNDEIWVGTNGSGLGRYDGSTWSHYTKAVNSIPSDTINCLKFDNAGDLWIGTRGGLAKYSDGSFYEYGMNIIEDIEVDDQNVKWIASYDGLTRLTNNSMTLYSRHNTDLTGNRITEVVLLPNGDKWLGTQGYGIVEFSNDVMTFYTTANTGISSQRINSGALDLNGDLWFGHCPWTQGVGGLSHYSTANGTWERILDIPSPLIEWIHVDEFNRKWLGTGAGLGKMETDGTLTKYDYSNTGILMQHVTCIVEDNNGDLWISTRGAGLIKLRKDRL